MNATIFVILVVVIIFLYALSIKNRYVTLDNYNKEAWSNIKVYLQKRLDLIPNLVNTVKGYAKHEKETFEAVINARNKMISIDMGNIQNVDKILEQENILSKTLKSIMMLHEAYPELKADSSFLSLQEELKNIESEILAVRKYYNGTCRELNIFVERFPNSLFFSIFNFRRATLFEPNVDINQEVKVEF